MLLSPLKLQCDSLETINNLKFFVFVYVPIRKMLTPQNSTVCLRVCFFGCILLFENVYETPDSLGIVMTIFFSI